MSIPTFNLENRTYILHSYSDFKGKDFVASKNWSFRNASFVLDHCVCVSDEQHIEK